MRLIKLKVKNIASLKGEHLIDFAHIQNQSPLFAITGETGAGKSTILNAIGLVLYGKVYKSGVNQNDLVTLGEKEGQIELIFQTKGKYYLAFWRAKIRKANGELYSTPQTPQRELYQLEGADFSSARTILSVRIEELLNLDFDQFCKCIILNQGEFARFLASSFTERKDILEKLYPGELLESLSKELKNELDILQKQKNDLDIELAALKGDNVQGEDLVQLKDTLESSYKLHEKWLKKLEDITTHFSSLDTYRKKFLETQERMNTIRQTMAQETKVFNELFIISQKATEELTTIQALVDKEQPRLQELLKIEETLKLQLDQKEQAQKTQSEIEEQSKLLESKLQQNKLKLENWGIRSQDLIKSFNLPLNELKTHSKILETVFDHYTEKELLEQDLAGKTQRLEQLKIQGTEEANALKALTDKKIDDQNIQERLKALEAQKIEFQASIESYQRVQIKKDELEKSLLKIHSEKNELAKLNAVYSSELVQLQQEYYPIESTLKLQELLNAVEVCLTHSSLEESKACPVCKSQLNDEYISNLKINLQKTDFAKIKIREHELSRLIMKKESDIQQVKEKLEKISTDDVSKRTELDTCTSILSTPKPQMEKLEQEIKEVQKKVWEQQELLKEEARLNQALLKSREQYSILNSEIITKMKKKTILEEELNLLTKPMSFIKQVDGETINQLKTENRKLILHSTLEAEGSQLRQEKAYLEETFSDCKKKLESAASTLTDLNLKIQKNAETLCQELKGKKASELIQDLNNQLKEKLNLVSTKERELKSQENKLKDCQGRLYTLDELIKEIDLHFVRESHIVRELAISDLSGSSTELDTLLEKLKSLGLEPTSPESLFISLKEVIGLQSSYYKEKTSELKMEFASVRARLQDWEKRQDRINLLQLKSKDLEEQLDRHGRLYEVLGKDELRTFVLSLVEESLITQTNEELAKLCQGRYEIVHQSKRMKLTPEFYILDKFREGGLRKVSTLSGGETFMVSLAMAFGLAEMTRGKAEIDSLFIDEGFGTLDQESLEDVLDMLKQIQSRGLMVGLISHVKALTSALPVNLQVTKKQDGTSFVEIKYN